MVAVRFKFVKVFVTLKRMKLPVVDESVAGKRVFLRGDIDVPLRADSGERIAVSDDTRLKDIWPTIEFLLGQGCTLYLAGHLGRPKLDDSLSRTSLSSRPVAEWMNEQFKSKFKFQTQGVLGICLKGNICGFSASEKLVVLENLRFDSREEANDEAYAKELADLADVYVNEAFAASEREHASIVGVPKFLPHFAGFRLAREMEVLSRVLENPRRPLVVVVGGNKPETKLPLITKMKKFAEKVITREDLVMEPGGKDATLESIEKLTDVFAQAGTIVWNGPVGRIEEIPYQVGTRKLAELIVASGAYKIVGGGDTVGFVNKLGLAERFDWVCSGGGSMLKFLAGETLSGVEALLS